MAFAALGAAEILDSRPGHSAARALLYRAHVVIGDPAADAGWPWPASRLSHASGAVTEAVIVAGHYLEDDRLLRRGLRMLEWLLAAETRDGHLSVVSRHGWGRGEAAHPPASDQLPGEVAALADACVRAATVTGDDTWLAGGGRSRNQGAGSTLAMIAVLQHGHRIAAAPARAYVGQGDSPAGAGHQDYR